MYKNRCHNVHKIINTSSRQHQIETQTRNHITQAGKSTTETKSAQSNDGPNKFEYARQLFDEMPDLNVVSATALIGRFDEDNRFKEAIYTFSRMIGSAIKPNNYTFGTVIHSSIMLKDLFIGKQLHACAMKMGYFSNVYVGSAFLDFYAKLSTLEESQRVLKDTHLPNVVSYTTLLSAYLKKERFEDAFELFKVMPERNVVTWNAMICGCSQKGFNEEAVNVFIGMMRVGSVPNQSTFPCVFTAVANVAALGVGRSFHACAVKCLGKLEVFVGNSLISFYAKCGSMEDSLLVFDKLKGRNTVSWNAVICGYAQNGRGEKAVEFFERMQNAGYAPNSVTYLGLFWACNHAGLVDQCYSYFNQARVKNPGMLKPEHYACVVDSLARSGRFEEAEEFLYDLPFDPGVGFWKALLGGCQIHSNLMLGEFATRRILSLDPEDVSSYVMLSNALSASGRWQGVSAVRREMKEKGMKRVPGCSWIEIRSKIQVFVNRDCSHPEKHEMYSLLFSFYEHMRECKDPDYLVGSSI